MRRNKNIIKEIQANCRHCQSCDAGPLKDWEDTFHAKLWGAANSSKDDLSFKRPEYYDPKLNWGLSAAFSHFKIQPGISFQSERTSNHWHWQYQCHGQWDHQKPSKYHTRRCRDRSSESPWAYISFTGFSLVYLTNLVGIFCIDIILNTLRTGFLKIFWRNLDEVGDSSLNVQMSRW